MAMFADPGCPECGQDNPKGYTRYEEKQKDGQWFRRDVALGCAIHGDYAEIIGAPWRQIRG
jgi:hypothetical protein